MKITVIGTSNCVIGQRGFLQALSHEHDIQNLSSGRTTFYKHIKTIIEHRAAIEDSDLLIIDHSVNDVNFYAQAFGDSYATRCEEFYDFLSTLNTRVLSLLFPMKDTQSKPKDKARYNAIKAISLSRGISCLDLNEQPFQAHHFRDRMHLTTDVSYLVGLSLRNALKAGQPSAKPHGGGMKNCPFHLVSAKSLVEASALKTFKNNLLQLDYFELTESLRIAAPPDHALLAIGYLHRPKKKSASGLRINGNDRGLAYVSGYFLEPVDIDTRGDILIEPLAASLPSCSSLMRPTDIHAPFQTCCLSDFLFYDTAAAPQWSPAQRSCFEIQLPEVPELLAGFCAPSASRRQTLFQAAAKPRSLLRRMLRGLRPKT